MKLSLRQRLRAVGIGLLLDATFGEPNPHPVAMFGTAMTRLEKEIWKPSKRSGMAYVATGVIGASGVAKLADVGLGESRALSLAVATCAASRSLFDAATQVHGLLLAGDLEGARAKMPALVGRDPSSLDEAELARAVIESVAENLVDAVVATAFFGVVGSSRGVLVHRAINTMDAMVGYRSKRYEAFGWSSARLDDAMAFIPARLCVALIALASLRPPSVWQAARVAVHPSPNAGLIEAGFAGALGITLGGENHYGDRVEIRASLGSGRPPETSDIVRAVDLAKRVVALISFGLIVGGVSS